MCMEKYQLSIYINLQFIKFRTSLSRTSCALPGDNDICRYEGEHRHCAINPSYLIPTVIGRTMAIGCVC